MKDPRKKTVLITGAAGALAQQVINRLHGHYNLVVCDARREVSMPEDIPSYQVDFNKRRFEDLFREHHFDSIIHLGRIGTNEYSREGRYAANVLGSQRLLDLARKYQVGQTLILSTYFVYGAHPLNPAYLTEAAPLKAAGITMDLVDSVELENLATIYLWKYPELNITILRPCNIVGPGVNNTLSQLLMQDRVPVLMGFSPMMQFIHLEDMAEAIAAAFEGNQPGIYNVAPDDCVPYAKAVALCGCKTLPVPSTPASMPALMSRLLGRQLFPPHLLNYFKYAATIDGSLFATTFRFKPRYSLRDIFTHYRHLKS
ncbi:UDP-glucose 4-epimerase [Fluviicoccus keumensis]|uniref:UDP-glucose 4-epimerase n=1 Tax=Fluviicoccus keumensis TaxID=1435465 RepID=A0A4Q7YJP8_9GAMM|nr:SDR family oxidoreductase [Fluviicoccus keumensis]RZU37084.1 UDP-glucose 4-epimerase [Fluviicoccus keumensis]